MELGLRIIYGIIRSNKVKKISFKKNLYWVLSKISYKKFYLKYEKYKMLEGRSTFKLDYSKKTEDFNVKICEGEECVILLNGPSLTDSLLNANTLEFIKTRKKMCVNSSFLDERILSLKPEFLIFMDPNYWSQNFVGPELAIVHDLKERLSLVDWKIKIFMPISATIWNFFIDIPLKNPNVEIVYINANSTQTQDEKIRFIEFKQNLAMPRVQNVLVACIYLGINWGFEKIYLLGADHSWHENILVTRENIPCLKNIHFYEKESEVALDPFYKDPECTQIFTMADLFEAFMNMYRSYEELEQYSKFMGVKILNASEISYIDAFERIQMQELTTGVKNETL